MYIVMPFWYNIVKPITNWGIGQCLVFTSKEKVKSVEDRLGNTLAAESKSLAILGCFFEYWLMPIGGSQHLSEFKHPMELCKMVVCRSVLRNIRNNMYTYHGMIKTHVHRAPLPRRWFPLPWTGEFSEFWRNNTHLHLDWGKIYWLSIQPCPIPRLW